MIKDLNRGRKAYSFFRARPAPISLVTIEQIVSGSGGDDLLTFPNIAALAAYNVTSNAKQTGDLAFVDTVRDYWYLDRLQSLGTPDNISIVTATGGGTWYRLGLGRAYWQNREDWSVDPSGGDDENYGDFTAPLKTQFEQLRRLGYVNARGNSGHAYNFIAGLTETSSSVPQIIYTFIHPTQSLIRYEADFLVGAGGGGAAASAFIKAMYMPSGSTLELVGGQTQGADALGIANGWGCSMAASGTTVVFAVTGSNSGSQFWMLNLQIEQLGN